MDKSKKRTISLYQTKSRQTTKYGNVKTGGYDSKKEKRRSFELNMMQVKGLISDLKEQIRFTLIPSHFEQIDGKKKCIEKSCVYVADFTYIENGHFVVEDVKSEITRKNPTYVIKRKLMLQVHNVKIRER